MTAIAQPQARKNSAAPQQQPNREAASRLRLYAARLNETNVAECCGKAEGCITNLVYEGKLPREFVFEQNLRHYSPDLKLREKIKYTMSEARQETALRENVRERKRADRGKAIASMFPEGERERFALLAELGEGANDGQARSITAKALALAGMLGKAIADAAENGGQAVHGMLPGQWVDGAIRPIFEALAKNVEGNGGPNQP